MHARLKLLMPILLVAVTVGLYWPSLHYQPFFDDLSFFEQGLLNQIFLNGFAFELRWLPYFTTAWIGLIFEDGIFAQRSISVGFHLATAFVLYSLVKQISNHVAPHPNNERAAIAAAALFLLHPLAIYTVGYIVQRTLLLATLFGMLSLSTYFDGLVTRRKAYFFFSALFYLLSAFSKEHAVLIPAAALALTPLAVPLTRHTWRQLVLPFSLFVPIAILVVLKSQSSLGRVYEPFAEQLVNLQLGETSQPVIWLLSIMTQASLFFKYLGLMLIPYPGWMSIDMRVPFAAHLWEPKYVLGLLAFVIYGATALFLLLKGGRRGLAGFALLAPLLLFAVEFSTVRIQEPFVLYRSYLWMAPLFLLIPAVSYTLPNKLFWSVVLVMALALAFASGDRLNSFSSKHALWDDAVRKLPDERAPGSARAHSNRGYSNVKRGDLQASIEDFTRALRVDPRYRNAYQNRAIAYMKLGDYPAALRDANTAIQLYPEDPSGFTARGVIYRSKGELDLAMADFEHACKQKSVGGCWALKLTTSRGSP
ncbi:MAG: tetratricopeptide repeat protein [Thiobacillus sp.]|nr:tetratricopeptide repeat protein [Thiobacillus sp.]